MRTVTGSPLGGLLIGAGFGAATSLSNRLASPVEPDSFARVASFVLDAGWAWAGVAMVAGCLAGAPARGAVAGALALVAATTVYFGKDSVLREEPFAWYWPEILRWWLASAVLGPGLGAVGAHIGVPGTPGLLAGLAIPVGATVQMMMSPPGAGSPVVTPAMSWARLIVWAAAAVGAAVVVTRFLALRRRRA